MGMCGKIEGKGFQLERWNCRASGSHGRYLLPGFDMRKGPPLPSPK